MVSWSRKKKSDRAVKNASPRISRVDLDAGGGQNLLGRPPHPLELDLERVVGDALGQGREAHLVQPVALHATQG